MPETVFDPELPDKVRKAYASKPGVFTPAGRPKPPKRSEMAASPGEAIGGLVVGAGIFTGLWFVVRWLSGALLPDGTAGVVTTVAGVFFGLLGLSFLVYIFSESEERKLAREYHSRYLLPEDFDDEAAPLMDRAQEAVKAIRSAQVIEQGLLDDIRHEVVLPAQLWDVGLLLQRQSELRRTQVEMPDHPALESVLRPQREALRKSAEAATHKVEALERLAERVRTADAALKVQELMPAVLGDSDKYLELLASLGTAGDTSLIEQLGDDASTVTDVLNHSIEEIRATSRELTDG